MTSTVSKTLRGDAASQARVAEAFVMPPATAMIMGAAVPVTAPPPYPSEASLGDGATPHHAGAPVPAPRAEPVDDAGAQHSGKVSAGLSTEIGPVELISTSLPVADSSPVDIALSADGEDRMHAEKIDLGAAIVLPLASADVFAGIDFAAVARLSARSGGMQAEAEEAGKTAPALRSAVEAVTTLAEAMPESAAAAPGTDATPLRAKCEGIEITEVLLIDHLETDDWLGSAHPQVYWELWNPEPPTPTWTLPDFYVPDRLDEIPTIVI